MRIADPMIPPMRPNILILSGHDYRTPRRASLHFIADELSRRGQVRFFSLGFSWLSKLKNDLRISLWHRANRVERVNGVDCYLWFTPLHPVHLRQPWLAPLERLAFRLYRRRPCAILRQWIAEADIVLFESGMSPLFADWVFRINPRARTIFRGSDSLAAIGVSPFVQELFARAAPRLDAIGLASPRMARTLPPDSKAFFVPHGLDPSIAGSADPCPYPPGIHAVSVGSMLFDADFFVVAGQAFPDITFHVIGCGKPTIANRPANVRLYDHMPYTKTLRYIKHARLGIAPYVSGEVPDYLADTSMKLIQYQFFGIPAVCPHVVVGDRASRFGYQPGDRDSVIQAIRAALNAPRLPSSGWLNWPAVVDRLLEPDRYPDTRLPDATSNVPERVREKQEA